MSKVQVPVNKHSLFKHDLLKDFNSFLGDYPYYPYQYVSKVQVPVNKHSLFKHDLLKDFNSFFKKKKKKKDLDLNPFEKERICNLF